MTLWEKKPFSQIIITYSLSFNNILAHWMDITEILDSLSISEEESPTSDSSCGISSGLKTGIEETVLLKD